MRVHRLQPSTLCSFLAVGMLSFVPVLVAQAMPGASPLPKACAYLVSALPAPSDPVYDAAVASLTQPGPLAYCIWEIALSDRDGAIEQQERAQQKAAAAAAATTAEKSSSAVQPGAAAGSSGTTSAVSKPATPLSLATEYGGITTSISNQTVTLQAPLDGIPRALAKKGTLPYCSTTLIEIKHCVNGAKLDFFNRISIGLSMNTSTPSNSVTATATGTTGGATQAVSAATQAGSKPSFAGGSFKAVLVRPRLELPKVGDLTGVNTQLAALNAVEMAARANPAYQSWVKCVLKDMTTGSGTQSALQLLRQGMLASDFVKLKSVVRFNISLNADCSVPSPSQGTADANLVTALEKYIAASLLVEASGDASSVAASAAILTFEYDYAMPQNQLSNSTFKIVGSKSWPKPPAGTATAKYSATFNFGASTYNSSPPSSVPGAEILRDVQAGLELDRVIASSKWPGVLGKIGDTTASLTYYFQDLTSPSIIKVTPGTPLSGITLVGLPSAATTIFTQKGDIHVAQLKYGLGTGKSVKFPLAVTYSNRTDLIVHPGWAAQFGVYYDFSTLLSTN